jgi:hypothetical protein
MEQMLLKINIEPEDTLSSLCCHCHQEVSGGVGQMGIEEFWDGRLQLQNTSQSLLHLIVSSNLWARLGSHH